MEHRPEPSRTLESEQLRESQIELVEPIAEIGARIDDVDGLRALRGGPPQGSSNLSRRVSDSGNALRPRLVLERPRHQEVARERVGSEQLDLGQRGRGPDRRVL